MSVRVRPPQQIHIIPDIHGKIRERKRGQASAVAKRPQAQMVYIVS